MSRRTLAIRRGAQFRVSTGVLGLTLLTLGGCASLPSNGPDTKQVLHESAGPAPAFKIVDLTSATVGAINTEADTRPEAPLTLGAAPAQDPTDQIRVGDLVQVTIFEVGPALFASGGGASASMAAVSPPAANAANLPVVPVDPNGEIVVPYVGPVMAAGRTPDELAAAIEAGLRGKSQSPQVLVTVRENVGNTVVMIGDVKTPGRKPLGYRRESLLDMIAIAGGPTEPKADTLVRVTRAGRAFETRLGDIRSGEIDDIQLQPEDRVELIYHPRTFTAFGATGKVSEVAFQTTRLSLAQALARIGGPSDSQADPTGVFIFRAGQPAGRTPVVYRLNMKDPKEMFVAQEFEVQDNDLILVANAQSNAWYKFLSIINAIVSPVVTAKYLGN